MDIMRPPLKHQVSPAPWLAIREQVDVPALIRKSLAAAPDATVDEVVHQLAKWGVDVSGVIVAMHMMKRKEAVKRTDAQPQG